MTEHQDDIPGPEDTTAEAISPAPSPLSSADPLIGTKIGSCTIKRIIGSGGMGTVYEAVQENPRRRIALKMMKRGITSRSATRRFEFESQTLARLKHQGVAQIYEAGTHDDGSGGVPYFVMEYVASAKTITQYADDKKLGTRDRLALFSKVCDAVQHGHLKGIVHRDLKPGNILVDSNGQPKVIDFGVARSTDSDLAVTTLQTDVGQLIGTLQYMSPEQCEADPLDIDARTDVYALGVVLYELLIGKTPYHIHRMAIHEAVRIIREEEPTKLSTVDRHLRGDIETIAMKALEKDRDRRYQSATALEEDIQHYLSDEPISARPPGAIDYLKRFARKHTAAAIGIAAVFVVLLGSVVAISIYAVEAERQRVVAEASQQEAIQEQTRAEAVKDFVTTMLSSVDPRTAGAMDKKLMMIVLSQAAESVGKKFKEQPLVEAEIRSVIGTTYYALGKNEEAEPHFVESLKILRRIRGNEHPRTLISIGHMGELLMNQGKYDEAQVYLAEALETQRRVLGNEHPGTLQSISNMGSVLSDQGKYDEAEVYYTEALETRRRVLGDEHPSTLISIGNMGSLLYDQGKYDEAQVYSAEALETQRRVLGNEHPNTLTSIVNMGGQLMSQGKYDEAQVYLAEALEGFRRVLGNEHPSTLISIVNMGGQLMNQGKYDEAQVYLAEALEGFRRVLGNEHPHTLYSINALVELYDAWKKPEEAKKYRDMLPEEDAATEDSE
jgi:tetratricopeptide (TPR) repeat protein